MAIERCILCLSDLLQRKVAAAKGRFSWSFVYLLIFVVEIYAEISARRGACRRRHLVPIEMHFMPWRKTLTFLKYSTVKWPPPQEDTVGLSS